MIWVLWVFRPSIPFERDAGGYGPYAPVTVPKNRRPVTLNTCRPLGLQRHVDRDLFRKLNLKVPSHLKDKERTRAC